MSEKPFTEAVREMSDEELAAWRKRYLKRTDNISMIHASSVRAEIARRKRASQLPIGRMKNAITE